MFTISKPFPGTEQPFEVRVYGPDEYADFIRLFATSKDKLELIGFDYEGSSLDPLARDFQVAGIGLSNGRVTAYIHFKSFDDLEYRLSGTCRKAIRNFLSWLNENKRLLVFNLKYEVGVTQNSNTFGLYLTNITDVMQMCRTLDITGGLKTICVNHLKIPSWKDDVTGWVENVTQFLQMLKPTTVFRRKEEGALREGGFQGLREFIAASDKSMARNIEVAKIFQVIWSMGCEYYSPDVFGEKFRDYILSKIDRNDYECNYSEIPLAAVAYYCGLDCYNTLLLRNSIQKILEEKNLTNAASYYNLQMYLGHDMQVNGIFWDDAKAGQLVKDFQERMIGALRKFVLSKTTRPFLGVSTNQQLLDIQSTTDLVQLKKYFNPDSSAPKEIEKLANIFSGSRIKICLLLHEANTALLSEAMMRKGDEQLEPVVYPTLKRMIDAALTTADKVGYIDGFASKIRRLVAAGTLSPKEKAIVAKYAMYRLPNGQAETIQTISDALLKFSGSDVDNPDTWIDEFAALFYYKLYKKISKCVSSFINGAGGRGNCWVSYGDTEGYYTRDQKYYPGVEIPGGAVIIYEPAYGVNMAKTKRWTAAYHGVPTMSDSQSCWISRYADMGIFFGGDFSQHELRIIASVSKDKNMIEAFLQGKDLHKMVASRMYEVAEEAVTANQRAVAKAANFGLVYLKTAEAFAQEYLNNDVEAAVRLFDGIFTMFSGMRDWRNGQIAYLDGVIKLAKKMRAQATTVTINTLWGDPIYHTFNHHSKWEYIDACRYVVNWVIQSTASNLAALALAETNRWLKENHMLTKPFGFTHDNEKFDAHLTELGILLQKVPEVSEKYLFDQFDLPVKLDMEIGATLGGTVEIKRQKGRASFVDESGAIAMSLDGPKDDIESTIVRLGHYFDCETVLVSEKVKNNSWKDLFSIKGCYFSGMGQSITEQKMDLILRH